MDQVRSPYPHGWRQTDISSLLSPFWTWYLEYKPFKEMGSDTIVTVAPGGITFHTSSPEIINQIGTRRRDFQKPLELYNILNTYIRHSYSRPFFFWLPLASAQILSAPTASPGGTSAGLWRPPLTNRTTRWSGARPSFKQHVCFSHGLLNFKIFRPIATWTSTTIFVHSLSTSLAGVHLA